MAGKSEAKAKGGGGGGEGGERDGREEPVFGGGRKGGEGWGSEKKRGEERAGRGGGQVHLMKNAQFPALLRTWGLAAPQVGFGLTPLTPPPPPPRGIPVFLNPQDDQGEIWVMRKNCGGRSSLGGCGGRERWEGI